MKRSMYIWLGLLVVVLLVAYYVIRPIDRKEESYQLPDLKLALDITKLVKVEIERNKNYIRMERVRNVWKVMDPVNFVVDDEAIYRLLEGMAKFKLTGIVSSNPEKYGMFQVDEKGTTLTITYDDNRTTTLIVGKAGPTPNQTYVRPVNSNSVYLARGLSSFVVNKELRDWRQRTIYHTDPNVIKYFKLESDTGSFVLRREGKRWLANKKPVATRNVNPVLNALSYVRAEDFIDTALIINSPREVHVELVAPELVRMDIYGERGAHAQHYLKTSFSPTIYVVSNAMVQDLKKLANLLATPKEGVATSLGVQPRPAAKDTEISPAAQQVLATLTSLQSMSSTTTYTTQEEQGELVIHPFQKGQTLADVAKKYKVTVDQIKKWNLLKSDVVKPGMDLYIFTKKKK